jgi:hypothetical protein
MRRRQHTTRSRRFVANAAASYATFAKSLGGTQSHTIKFGWYRGPGEYRLCGVRARHGGVWETRRPGTLPSGCWARWLAAFMSILSQALSGGKFEYHRPGRTYKKRSGRIKRGKSGLFYWESKKGKVLTIPTSTRKEAKRLQNQKETPLQDLKLKEGELTFSADRVVGGNSFHVEYKFMINGDTLKGKGTLDVGGEKRDFDIEGKREK